MLCKWRTQRRSDACGQLQMPVVSFRFAGPFAKHLSWVQSLTDPQGIERRLHEMLSQGTTRRL